MYYSIQSTSKSKEDVSSTWRWIWIQMWFVIAFLIVNVFFTSLLKCMGRYRVVGLGNPNTHMTELMKSTSTPLTSQLETPIYIWSDTS